MNGILIIDKPAGITSHDVVARVRRILNTKRVGHTGTLDPFATGVMVILVGQATRLAQFLDKDEKEYEATIRFGFETDTGDLTGSPRSQVSSPKAVSLDAITSVLPDFIGEMQQTPPMYSAKKIDGRKLYDLARKGTTVERKAASVTISELKLLPPRRARRDEPAWARDSVEVRIVCSAGTYVRTLAEEIARAAGTLGHLIELRRTRAGKFSISEAVTLDQLGALDDPSSPLSPVTKAVEHLSKLIVPDDRVEKTKAGLATRVFEGSFADGEPVRLVDADENLIAVGRYDRAENSIRPKIVLI